MLRRLTGLCTLSLALTIAGCPSNPEPVDAPIGGDTGDAGPPTDTRTDVRGDAGGPVCGNGTVETGETCDDDNTTTGDGCDDACAEETGWDCDGASPTVCTEICGDGNVVGDEAGANGCDDNNTAADDGCGATCMVEMGWACTGEPSTCTPDCGDGAITGSEACDDDNNVDNDGCSMSCQVEDGWDCGTAEPSVCTSTCGDGTIAVGAETCDDMNTVAGDGCDATCQTESGWDCSMGGCAPICGDMMVIGGEECDDGNVVSETCMYSLPSCTICASDCTEQPGLTSFCGDTNVDMMNGEMCDDGNIVTETACAYGTATCMACSNDCMMALTLTGPVCGDGNTDAGEETCDDGNTTAGDGCSDTCQVESVCGDGAIEGLETCDDSNTAAGDGCSASCATETGWLCTGTPSTCVPTCAALAEPTVLNCASGLVMGNTADGTNLVNNYACSSFNYPNNEQVWQFTNETGGPVEVRIVATRGASTRDSDLYVLNASSTAACGAATCADSSTGTTGTETVDFGATAAQSFFVAYDIFSTPAGATTDYTLAITCTPTVCGDGTRSLTEQCDDGNTTASDGCSATCTRERGYTCTTASPNVCTLTCGNGVIAGGETCDDGNRATGDGCDDDCRIETGFICSGTPSMCRRPTCGDGFRDAPETCDDGNTTASDGCSATCTVESGFRCNTATPNVCTPLPYLFAPITAACVSTSAGASVSIISDDAVSTSAALPFSFPFFGGTVTDWVMSSNGNLQLIAGSGSTAFTNAAIPTTAVPNSLVAPFWDDLLVTGTPAASTARVLTTGTAPNRVFVAEWANFRPSGAATGAGLTFQAMLYETTGVIEFHYCSITGTEALLFGSSATIGVENAGGTDGTQFSFNRAAAISAGTGLRFTPNP